jgi:hypothetical protein
MGNTASDIPENLSRLAGLAGNDGLGAALPGSAGLLWLVHGASGRAGVSGKCRFVMGVLTRRSAPGGDDPLPE